MVLSGVRRVWRSSRLGQGQRRRRGEVQRQGQRRHAGPLVVGRSRAVGIMRPGSVPITVCVVLHPSQRYDEATPYMGSVHGMIGCLPWMKTLTTRHCYIASHVLRFQRNDCCVCRGERALKGTLYNKSMYLPLRLR